MEWESIFKKMSYTNSFFFLLVFLPNILWGFAFSNSKRPLLEDEKNTISIFKKNVKSVVNVTNKRIIRYGGWFNFQTEEVPAGAGSGFIWDKDGHIVTNYHVVAKGSSFVISFHNDPKQYEAHIVGVEPRKDIAVLKLLKRPPTIYPVNIGDSKSLQVGQTALAIGNPFGLDHTLTKGIVSALDRKIEGIGGVKIHQMIQTDCAINPGNSGGPLLNSDGKLIGMNTAIYSRSGSNAGVGFAVPIDTIKGLVPQLIKYGKIQRAGIGISLFGDQVGKYIKRVYEVKRGIIIKTVFPGGPAARAGLKGIEKDRKGQLYLGDIIIEIAGEKVNNYSDISNVLDNKKPGDKVQVKYLRKYKVKVVTMILTKISN